ncbi:MAG: T9SS type A sorting domain-containing protein [Tannerellaceae bacterium]|nr:T9SS type A sorting domain-containing protein [Tannerellaceae bacterium]
MYRVRVTKGPGGSSQAIVRGRPQNCAGWADEWILTFLQSTSSYSISASPGSGGTTLYVQIDTDSEAYEAALSQSGSGVSTGVTSQPVFTVGLYNSQGIMVRQTTARAGTATLDIANLPNGYYILQVHDGSANPPQTQNILISH